MKSARAALRPAGASSVDIVARSGRNSERRDAAAALRAHNWPVDPGRWRASARSGAARARADKARAGSLWRGAQDPRHKLSSAGERTKPNEPIDSEIQNSDVQGEAVMVQVGRGELSDQVSNVTRPSRVVSLRTRHSTLAAGKPDGLAWSGNDGCGGPRRRRAPRQCSGALVLCTCSWCTGTPSVDGVGAAGAAPGGGSSGGGAGPGAPSWTAVTTSVGPGTIGGAGGAAVGAAAGRTGSAAAG